jgi:CBS domain-containing protein
MLVKDMMQSVKIHTVSGELTIQEAAAIMSELGIGALIVGNPEKIEGIFSERDILKKVIGRDLSIIKTKVRDVMSTKVIVIEDTEMAYTAIEIMQERKYRHLPVVNNRGICIGMVGIRDLMKSVSDNIEKENKALARKILRK